MLDHSPENEEQKIFTSINLHNFTDNTSKSSYITDNVKIISRGCNITLLFTFHRPSKVKHTDEFNWLYKVTSDGRG